ncbi:MAG: hypothetical protein WCG87_13105 [Bacteroidota bacterium]
MVEEYEMNFHSQLVNATSGIIYFIMYISTLWYFEHYHFSHTAVLFTIFSSTIFLLILCVPQIALHINYYKTNHGDVFIFDTAKKEIIFSHNGLKVEFHMDDIESLVLYKSLAVNRGDIQYLAWDAYNHGIITLKNKTRIIITSLLVGGEFKLPIPKDKIEVNASLYRWVKGESLVFGNS